MKSHWFSRGLFVSVALVSSIGVAACSRASDGAGETPEAPAAVQAESQVTHGPGYRMFRQIEALDLTTDQQEELRLIESDLASEATAHRDVLRHVAETLARGLESGTLDAQEAERDQAAMQEAAADMRAAVTVAVNEVHDVLDADQREALVEQLQSQRWQPRDVRQSLSRDVWQSPSPDGAEERPGLGKLAATLGLDEKQEQALRDEIRAHVEKVFPDRKARREAWEAKMQALAAAFVEDDFDAAEFDLGAGADEAIASFTAAANKALDISGRVLDPSQRQIAAALLRSHAAKL